MSANRFQPHILVLPEDDANRQLALGFQLGLDPAVLRRVQVLPVAGGWTDVLDHFETDQIADMDGNASRYMILLIDFDGKADRLKDALGRIPGRLKDRVFILGAAGEPEDLKGAGLGSYETIGEALAKDCRDETDKTWGHDLLKNNTSEIGRLRERVRSFLFP